LASEVFLIGGLAFAGRARVRVLARIQSEPRPTPSWGGGLAESRASGPVTEAI
jgi:hypothetical protein